ncbi:conserved hypothetical protein [Methanosarcina thermophila]|uniref:Uncharacterized protein n=1 Tax=Methanosarcina thermophila TaxID=2210 RepID=A0A3G9CWR3_METTE|nr:conserved hypothetical protein [Methanosarcina thermophila]
MDTVSELNSHPLKIYFQRDEGSNGITPVITAQDHLQYNLKLLKTENVGDKEIVVTCLSGVQAMIAARILTREGAGRTKISNDRKLTGGKKKPEKSRRDFTGKRIQKT